MAWVSVGTQPSLVLSETTVGNGKTLLSTDLPTSQFINEIEIKGIRIELTTSGVAGTRAPVIQVQRESDNDVIMSIPLSTFATLSSTKVYEAFCGVPVTAEVSTGAWTATNVALNMGQLLIGQGQKLVINSASGGDSGDSYVVHIRAVSV